MNRLSRINTIWRKELLDTLRDRRTLLAMVLVPIVLYPAMIVTMLQGGELQQSQVRQEVFNVAVESEAVRTWLRWLLDTDATRHEGVEGLSAEELARLSERGQIGTPKDKLPVNKESEGGRPGAWDKSYLNPPKCEIFVVPDEERIKQLVRDGHMHVGLLGRRIPTAAGSDSTALTIILDQTEFRSRDFAAPGVRGALDRFANVVLLRRLKEGGLPQSFLHPVEIAQDSVATPEKVGGSVLGLIVPLILVVMTITGAIYPAIDLTAGERERGTLETLMVAPVPTVDLIAGKFVVVALIGMLSAALNLLSIGGTIYLGGLGDLLSQGGAVVIPLRALPWVLLLLVPLAIMFGAVLLAVCSFARSFKEAQNYVMPVMVAAMIPAVVGALPGTRLEGPVLIMPVTNIVVLTRDLFTGKFDVAAILWVTLSTTLYAGAAVAVAAKLFGQEAVLFADSGSIKTIFQRRFFKPARYPSAAQALLLLALVFSLNFFAQQALLKTVGTMGTLGYWAGLSAVIVFFFLLLPLGAAGYMRVDVRSAFALARPPLRGWLAALCFGLSTWVLAQVWIVFQSAWLPMPPEMERVFQDLENKLRDLHPGVVVFCLALVPAICEEFFFRGYALSGLRGALGKVAAVLIVAAAFGIHHHSIHRLVVAGALGVLFGLLAVQFRSIWPAVVAHFLFNAITVLRDRPDGLKPLFDRLGFAPSADGLPPLTWVIGAGVLTMAGILLCLLAPKRERRLETEAKPVAG